MSISVRRALSGVPLAQAYTGRANSFGLLRLVFASTVLLAHTAVLGYAEPLSMVVDLPGLGVAGFFGVSGFLITRSAYRASLPRFLWHRVLRIFPGLWMCLLFTGFVVAPALWYGRTGTLDGLWRTPGGVVDYVRLNWWSGHRQFGILDLLVSDTPYGRLTHGSVFNGSLWTLGYEVFCYLIVAALAVVGVLRRARWIVLSALVGVFGVLCWNQFSLLRFGHDPIWIDGVVPAVPSPLGSLLQLWFLRYGFMFLAGAAAALFSDRIRINDLLGVTALIALTVCALRNELFGPILLAYEYVILWVAVRLPQIFHRVGQTNDYSYGIYIYAFVVQQVLAKFGVPKLGFVAYFIASASGTFVLSSLSWHLIEKPALRLKNWMPRIPQALRRADADAPTDAPTDAPADTPVNA